jgi:DNA-binding PadR family transcriptional regulator
MNNQCRNGFRNGRNASAFILLFLKQEPMSGIDLLNKIKEQVPASRMDGACIYRTLKKLEIQEMAHSKWQKNPESQDQKIYTITQEGIDFLSIKKEEIAKKIKNFEFFLKRYEELS